jgi:hypothetical protein
VSSQERLAPNHILVDWTQYFAPGTDHTHNNPAGAGVVAGFVRDGIRSQNLALATYLR